MMLFYPMKNQFVIPLEDPIRECQLYYSFSQKQLLLYGLKCRVFKKLFMFWGFCNLSNIQIVREKFLKINQKFLKMAVF